MMIFITTVALFALLIMLFEVYLSSQPSYKEYYNVYHRQVLILLLSRSVKVGKSVLIILCHEQRLMNSLSLSLEISREREKE
jgi:hypothetical protein